MWRIVRKDTLLETDNGTIEAVRENASAVPGQRAAGGWRLRVWLLIFGGCLVVPALGFAGILIERHWVYQQRETEQRLAQVANDLAADVDRFLDNMIATLSVIAETSDFSPSGLPTLHEQARSWLSPLGLYLVYRNADGQQLLNTRLARGTTLPREQLPEIDDIVRATQRPHVSDVFRGAVAQQAIVTVTAPVFGGGKLQGFLHLSTNPGVLLELARSQNLPARWNTTLSDRKGVVIMRLHHHDRYVGTPLPERLQASGHEPGTAYRLRDLAGELSLQMVAFSRVSGWQVSANVPLAVARAPMIAEIWSILGAALAMLALMVLLAFTVARFIARPIRDIARFASLVEDEQVPPVLRSPLREANDVASSLRNASLRLQQRTHDLRNTLDRFQVALRGADIVVFAQDLDRRVIWVSDSSGDYPPEIIGRRDEELLPADSRSEAVALKRLALVSGKPQDRELKVGQGDAARFFRVRVEPVRDKTGEIVGLLGVSSEVTALKRSEQHNAFLVAELAHRAKNLLSVVQAIATETLRSGGVETFANRFVGRIKALAALQNLMVTGAQSGVALDELVRSQLDPFVPAGPDRLSIDGPPVKLRSQAANTLALAMHELATNAAKYGALSNKSGRVSVGWSIGADASGTRRFRMQWHENDGPPVAAPQSAGFGQQVLVGMTESTLQAKVSLDYTPSGVRWAVEAPADMVEVTA